MVEEDKKQEKKIRTKEELQVEFMLNVSIVKLGVTEKKRLL